MHNSDDSSFKDPKCDETFFPVIEPKVFDSQCVVSAFDDPAVCVKRRIGGGGYKGACQIGDQSRHFIRRREALDTIAILHQREILSGKAHPAEHVDFKEAPPVVIRYIFKRNGFENAEIIDQDVHVRMCGAYIRCCFSQRHIAWKPKSGSESKRR